jgi:stage V sporulation protein B
MGIKIAMFIGLPCAVGLFVLSAPVIDFLYNIDAERLIIAAKLMRTMAVAIVFLSLVQTLTGILQGVGKQHIPVINLFIGGVVKVVLMIVLVSNPKIEIQGAALSTAACYTVTGVLDAIYLIRYTKLKLNVLDTFIKPLVAALIMGGVAYLSYNLIISKIASNGIATLGAILAAAFVYLFFVLWMRMFSEEDLALIPGGRILKKLQFKNNKDSQENN